MFKRYGKKGNSLNTKPLEQLTKILPVSQILAEEKRNTLMLQIRQACALEDDRYESLCLSLVHNLLNHCQELPETSTSYYSHPGGVLDYALNRTEAALNLFQEYLIQENQAALSEEQKLWQYALFSAAILKGIGKLQIDYNVALYDNSGQFLEKWNPLLQDLVTGAYYHYELEKEDDENLRCRLNLLLARLLMPASGFAWIASNPLVLAAWLALLNEDPDAAGTLGAILIRADAIAIQRYFNQIMAKNYGARGSRYGRVGTFTGIPETVAEIEQYMGVEFIQWLMRSLDAGRLQINKAPLFMVPGGLLMSVDMFKLFVREHPEFKNWQAAQNAFLSLGLHKAGANDVSSRFEQMNNQKIHSGIVFANYAVVLPNTVQVHHLSTEKVTHFSATEFIHQSQANIHFVRQQTSNTVTALPHLTASGTWQVGTHSEQALFLKPGAAGV